MGWTLQGIGFSPASCMEVRRDWLEAHSGGDSCAVPTPSYAPGVWSSGSQNREQCPHAGVVWQLYPYVLVIPIPPLSLPQPHPSGLNVSFQPFSPLPTLHCCISPSSQSSPLHQAALSSMAGSGPGTLPCDFQLLPCLLCLP